MTRHLDPLLRAAAILLILAASALALRQGDPALLGPGPLAGHATEAGVLGIAALGLGLVLLAAGIDLSVGGVMLLAPVLAALLLRGTGAEGGAALLVAVATGAALGSVNAFLVAGLRVAPFLATLATLVLFRGLGLWLLDSRPVGVLPPLPDLAGLPPSIPILAALALAVHVVLRHTAFGRHLLALGHDPQAARRAGLPVRRIEAATYVLSGGLAALAGVLLLSQAGRIDAALVQGREVEVLAAALLGGASLFGGFGGPWGAVLGAFALQAIRAGLVSAGVDPGLHGLAFGAVILLALVLDGLRARRHGTSRRRAA